METTMIWDGLLIMLSYGWVPIVGVALGMIVGATPGLTSSNSMAILLPVILLFPPHPGLIFIISVYAGAEMSNSFPAILLKIPGTSAAAITCIEGFPLVEKGFASRALGACVLASALGGIIGGIISLTVAPVIATFALKLSPVEVSIVILFGIVIIAQVSTESFHRAILSGFFGLMVATIGTDPMYGQHRGTLGIPYLMDGIQIVPALIGLLAFSEVFLTAEKLTGKGKGSSMEAQVISLKEIGKGMIYCLKNKVEWVRSSLIGFFIGAIPGAGGSIASPIAYQQSMAFATQEKKKEYGRGSMDGLIAADAANNGMVGGSLIPVLTLGLPGSATTAIMLVAMGYHNLYLGPKLFAMNGDIAYAVLWSQFVAAPLILIFGTFFSYLAVRIVRVKMAYLLPLITAFIFIGGFAPRQYMFDIGVVVFFGFLGYIMKKFGYVPLAAILGIILGYKFEAGFFRGLAMGMGDPSIFFTRPIALGLWAVLFLTIFVPMFLHRKRRK